MMWRPRRSPDGHPLRIAYLTGQYPRYSDIWLQREVAALREHGVDLHTFTVRAVPVESLESEAQIAEHRATTVLLSARPWAGVTAVIGALRRPARLFETAGLAWATRARGVTATLKQAAYFAEAVLFARELRRRRIDHLHNHLSDSSCTVSMLTSSLTGIPYSFTMHGPSIFYEPMTWRIDEKIRRASFVACISYFCRSQAAAFVEPEHWDKLRVVHCGVDIDDRSPSCAHDVAGDATPTGRLLFVGRLTPVKGLPVLFDAIERLRDEHPDVHLDIVGDGPERDALVDDVARRGLDGHVSFVGTASPDAVRELLGRTDVFVLPSFAEGVPVVLMEAMAEEVPVVSTRIAGTSELVVEGESGLLVRPADPVALADAIGTLLGDAEMRRRFGAAGRATVGASFNSRTEALRLLELMSASGAP